MIRHVLRLAVVAAVIAPAAALADNPEADTETKSIFRCTPASGDFRISFEGPGATASAYAFHFTSCRKICLSCSRSSARLAFMPKEWAS